MFSNNPKIASFYPTSKRPNNLNYFNQFTDTSSTTITNGKTNGNNNLTFLNKGQTINLQDMGMSLALELTEVVNSHVYKHYMTYQDYLTNIQALR